MSVAIIIASVFGLGVGVVSCTSEVVLRSQFLTLLNTTVLCVGAVLLGIYVVKVCFA